MSSKQNSYLSAAKLKVICANILSSSFSNRHIAKIARVSPTSVERIRKKIKVLKPLVNVIKKHSGSVDYRNATPLMRDVLVKTVNEDLSNYAKKIKCTSLLIWGDKDEAVPVNEAKELDDLLENSALIVLPGTHYCYLENLDRVISILDNFL